MTHQEALAHHLSVRPVSPGNVGADHPDYKEFHHMFTLWAAEKERLEIEERVKGIAIEPVNLNRPSCTPRADYEWRDIPKRRIRPNRPAWSGADKEYNRRKKAEQRERDRQARAVLIREALSERGAA